MITCPPSLYFKYLLQSILPHEYQTYLFPKYFFPLYYYFPFNCATQLPSQIITLRLKLKLKLTKLISTHSTNIFTGTFTLTPQEYFTLRSLLPQEKSIFDSTVFLLQQNCSISSIPSLYSIFILSRLFSP